MSRNPLAALQSKIASGRTRRRNGEFEVEPRDSTSVELAAVPEVSQEESERLQRVEQLIQRAGDPETDPKQLTRDYLESFEAIRPNDGAENDENQRVLSEAIANNPSTPAELKRSIALDAGSWVGDETRLAIIKSFGPDLRKALPYGPANEVARELVLPPARIFSLQSGLLHEDDIAKALNGQDEDLRQSLDMTSWAHSHRFPSDELITRLAELTEEGDTAARGSASTYAQSRLITDAQRRRLAQHPYLAESVARGQATSPELLEELVGHEDPAVREAAMASLVSRY